MLQQRKENMKGPGIKEYLEYLTALKQTAHDEGKEYIDVSAREVHAFLSPAGSTSATCCQAMYQLMFIEDEVLQYPKGQSGFGTRLKVRYFVGSLENRELKFPPKKKGRPKTPEEQVKMKRMTTADNKTADELKELVCKWLDDDGWTITNEGEELLAVKDGVKWLIRAEGLKRGRRAPLIDRLFKFVESITDEDVKPSLVLNDSAKYRREWREMTPFLKHKLNVTLILVTKKGKVIEFE